MYLLLTQVLHPLGHIRSKLEELLGGEGGGSAVLLGKGRVCLQDSAFAEEVEEISVGSILNGDVQVPCVTGGGWAHGTHPSKEEYTAGQGP